MATQSYNEARKYAGFIIFTVYGAEYDDTNLPLKLNFIRISADIAKESTLNVERRLRKNSNV